MMKSVFVERNFQSDSEVFALVVETHHDGAIARTAIHRQDFPRRIGGARFVKNAPGWSEVCHLASTMTEKCLAAMIPADGQKSVVEIGEGARPTTARHAEILVEHVRIVREHDPGIIVGPDMDNAEAVQDLAANAEGLFDHFTGLSEANGGLAIDATGLTAQGVVAAVRACRGGELAEQRVSIQGFGAVGAHTARLLDQLGAKVVAINNKDVLFTDPRGLDVASLYAFFAEHGDDRLRDYRGAQRSERDAIFEVPTDIFVPAARTEVLATRDEINRGGLENPDARAVSDFHSATGVGFVVEGANHPLTREAEQWLESKGVTVLPDSIVNCGGLIGCWMEWEVRHGKGLKPIENLENVRKGALERTHATVTNNVKEILGANMSARIVTEQIAKRNRQILMTTKR